MDFSQTLRLFELLNFMVNMIKLVYIFVYHLLFKLVPILTDVELCGIPVLLFGLVVFLNDALNE